MTVRDRLVRFYFEKLTQRHPLVPPEQLRARARDLAQEELDDFDRWEDEQRLIYQMNRAPR